MINKGQIWIETVLYTLIGLSLIGLVLAFITPKINEARDNLVIEQTKEAMKLFDDKINFVISKGSGNLAIIDEFTIKKGELYINASNDSISFVVSGLSTPYSEPGVVIKYGRINLVSEEEQKLSTVRMTVRYNFNITYGKSDALKKIQPASTPYRFSIENINNSIINIEEIS